MSHSEHPIESNAERGYQPQADAPDVLEKGYQPEASAPVDLSAVKPPQGGTAIESPQSSAEAGQNQ